MTQDKPPGRPSRCIRTSRLGRSELWRKPPLEIAANSSHNLQKRSKKWNKSSYGSIMFNLLMVQFPDVALMSPPPADWSGHLRWNSGTQQCTISCRPGMWGDGLHVDISHQTLYCSNVELWEHEFESRRRWHFAGWLNRWRGHHLRKWPKSAQVKVDGAALGVAPSMYARFYPHARMVLLKFNEICGVDSAPCFPSFSPAVCRFCHHGCILVRFEISGLGCCLSAPFAVQLKVLKGFWLIASLKQEIVSCAIFWSRSKSHKQRLKRNPKVR